MSTPQRNRLEVQNTLQVILHFQSEIKDYTPNETYLMIVKNKIPIQTISFDENEVQQFAEAYADCLLIFIGIGVGPSSNFNYDDIIELSA